MKKAIISTLKRIESDYVYNSKAYINVFIIGLRGYTQNYGGWEAFAHGLLDNWNDATVHFFAYEKVDDCSKEEIINVNGITCIRVCEKERGSSAMMKYDRNCTDITCALVKKYNIKNPIMFHLGVRIGPYMYFKRHTIKKLGIVMMENPAGAEWRRKKWGKLIQIYLYISAVMMAKSTDCIVCDNEGVQELYESMLKGKKPILDCVAYGVDPVPPVDEEMPKKVSDYFRKWGIERNKYYLILGRFIPENNYEMMFKGFIHSKTDCKLLVICNYQTEIKKFYEHIKKTTDFENNPNIIMAGTLYDKEILHYIRQYARGYIHGHSVGGTNPGLLEAMAETNVNLLNDVSFNRYVGGKAAVYFKDEKSLTALIEKVDRLDLDEIQKIGKEAKERMVQNYSWEKIVEGYNRIFHTLLNV